MKLTFSLIYFLFAMTTLAQQHDFDALDASEKWTIKLDASDAQNWQDHWFLDGERAKVKSTENGLLFTAGPIERDDACHAVLWTKQSFKGDIKIEYEYTRTDTKNKWVNILYIQATGIPPYQPDIYQWKDQRVVPAMKTYFKNMKLLHISYAAFNNNTGQEYVRARQYPVVDGKNFNTSTEIPPASFNTGLFKPNQTYKITAIKTRNNLYFKVSGADSSQLFSWDISNHTPITNGRVGLRHMFTRSAQYSKFRVWTK